VADASQVAEVRSNTNEPSDSEDYTNTIVETLVDALGVNGASATIWRRKAAKYASLVDVSEAGSSHALGDLQKKALDMALMYEGLAADEVGSTGGATGRVRVHVIDRE
jgi:hypothetical protein